jgi:hypothetical protein
MSSSEAYYPKEENLGQNRMFWTTERVCDFPKLEMEGRRSCEGIVDNVCLFLEEGRRPTSVTE